MPLIIGLCILILLNVSYFWVPIISLILILRLFHGIGWGMTSTSIATVMSDIVPSKRRGKGTGYYVLSIILASSIAPIIAIAVMNYYSFNVVLTLSTVLLIIGMIIAQGISIAPIKKQVQNHTSTKSKLFEKRALFPTFLCLLLSSIVTSTSYAIMYRISSLFMVAFVVIYGWYLLKNRKNIQDDVVHTQAG